MLRDGLWRGGPAASNSGSCFAQQPSRHLACTPSPPSQSLHPCLTPPHPTLLLQSRVCGRRGEITFFEAYDVYTTPYYGATRRVLGKRNIVKLSGCFSAYPNDGYLNAQGVVAYKCKGDRHPTFVGVIADGEMVEAHGRH